MDPTSSRIYPTDSTMECPRASTSPFDMVSPSGPSPECSPQSPILPLSLPPLLGSPFWTPDSQTFAPISPTIAPLPAGYLPCAPALAISSSDPPSQSDAWYERFPKFPPELRIKILKAAMPPRVVEVDLDTENKGISKFRFITVTSKPSSLLYVSHETRAVAKEVHCVQLRNLRKDTSGSAHPFELDQPRTRISPADTILFFGESKMWPYFNIFNLSLWSKDALSKIQSVALGGCVYHNVNVNTQSRALPLISLLLSKMSRLDVIYLIKNTPGSYKKGNALALDQLRYGVWELLDYKNMLRQALEGPPAGRDVAKNRLPVIKAMNLSFANKREEYSFERALKWVLEEAVDERDELDVFLRRKWETGLRS